MSDIASLLNNAAGNGDITAKTATLLTNATTLREIKKGDGVSGRNLSAQRRAHHHHPA